MNIACVHFLKARRIEPRSAAAHGQLIPRKKIVNSIFIVLAVFPNIKTHKKNGKKLLF